MSRLETTLAPAPRFSQRVGLLAGGGKFPFYFAKAAREMGIEVVCVAIRDHAEAELAEMVDQIHWFGIAKLGGIIRTFCRDNIECVVMAGKIHKKVIYTPWRILHHLPDWRTVRFWLSKSRKDNKDDSLLLAVIDEFGKEGIRFASALEVCPELLVKEGVLTRRKPTARQRADIVFGWRLAKEIGRLDVGQTVAVKESAVLAVEAIEGTDEAILRAGRLCKSGGFTVVKVAKPGQDMRFDVPTVGPQTIESMRVAGASVVAIEADKTILIDAEETIQLANQLGMCIVSLREEQLMSLAAA